LDQHASPDDEKPATDVQPEHPLVVPQSRVKAILLRNKTLTGIAAGIAAGIVVGLFIVSVFIAAGSGVIVGLRIMGQSDWKMGGIYGAIMGCCIGGILLPLYGVIDTLLLEVLRGAASGAFYGAIAGAIVGKILQVSQPGDVVWW
jgi:hypothetical protein